ncbi:porin family protein [Polaribacter sp. Hel1_85]|uniref:porin family protein n=1 Tax=Polaribacter sp. Hel1_85 TaxID=1250005 RepID=UPI00052C951B|nr:porin family protein [Polaribacter sp. Hel1_85]KGL59109.1 hypothetical protein PHEL85_3383 [Polaribacter sp. Hel1_85]
MHTRKKYLIIFLFISSISMNGQNSNINFGIKTGLNYSNFKLNSSLEKVELIESENEIGFQVGGFVNFKIHKKFNIQTELLFNNLNTSGLIQEFIRTSPNEAVLQRFELNLNETGINFPVVIQYLIFNKFHLEAGIEMKYIIQQKLKKEYLPGPFEPLSNESLYFDYNSINLNLALGINYRISNKFGINTRYYHNLDNKNSIIMRNFNLGIEYHL